MESEWIHRRFKKSQEREADEKLQGQRAQNAAAAFNSMFDNLKGQVEADIGTYNRFFLARPECKATFDSTVDGFRVEVRQKAVRVRKENGATVIDVEYIDTSRRELGVLSPGNFSHVEVVSGDNGNIGYKHKDEFLADAKDVSERILDWVLCN
jgi:hypothetical protein